MYDSSITPQIPGLIHCMVVISIFDCVTLQTSHNRCATSVRMHEEQVRHQALVRGGWVGGWVGGGSFLQRVERGKGTCYTNLREA